MAQVVGVGREFIALAMAAPFLEREEEHQLALRWKYQHDEKALHDLTRAHMRLVISRAIKFRHYGLSLADLIQEGHVGLLEAAARFEPEREIRFSTYATWWIRASMQDFILRNWSIVRGGTSSAQKALFFNLRRLRTQLSQQGERQNPIVAFGEIAKILGVAPADVEQMDARMGRPDISLNAPLADGDDLMASERIEFLVDDKPLADETVGQSIDGDRRIDWLHEALSHLSERERRILQERRLTEESVTLESLGACLGISKERVRQIETRAMEKLKGALIERHRECGAEAMF
jgi:RNA polymerase sigma-32 factor